MSQRPKAQVRCPERHDDRHDTEHWVGGPGCGDGASRVPSCQCQDGVYGRQADRGWTVGVGHENASALACVFVLQINPVRQASQLPPPRCAIRRRSPAPRLSDWLIVGSKRQKMYLGATTLRAGMVDLGTVPRGDSQVSEPAWRVERSGPRGGGERQAGDSDGGHGRECAGETIALFPWGSGWHAALGTHSRRCRRRPPKRCLRGK